MWSELPLLLANLSEIRVVVLLTIFIVQVLREIGVPSPGVTQIILLYAGYQLTSGNNSIVFRVLIAIFLGNMCGSMLMYCAGRFLGSKLLERYGKYLRITPELMERAKAKLRSATFLSVVVGRLIPSLMMPISLVCGTMQLPIPKFMAGVWLSLTIWASAFVGLGVLSGNVAAQISPSMEQFPLLWGLLAAGVLALSAAYFFRRRRGKCQLKDAP